MGFKDVAQPKTAAERTALAQKTCDELRLDVDTWIDDLGDTARAAFGDLPNPAIVVDAGGTVRLKLPWCDPEALAKVLPELQRERRVLAKGPAEQGFLAAITAKPEQPTAGERHDRQAMLAWLVQHEPAHSSRKDWLAELLQDAPPQQRAWVERVQAPPK